MQIGHGANPEIACLLVLAVAAQAQYWNGYGYAGYAGFYGNYGGYYPYAGVRATTAYTGIPATAAVPATYPVAYGYPSYTATQYHAQDELGQASFGYAHPGQAASNLRDGFGNQIGSYAYINPEGEEVRVSYTADSRGFRVLSNNLPVGPVDNSVAPLPVQDTPEVAAAKADHAAAVAAAKSGVAPVAPVAPVVTLPVPVRDTPEVVAAKADHAAAVAAAKAASTPAVRAKRQVFNYGAAPFAYPGYAVSPYAYSVAAPSVYAAPAVPVREATLTKTILNPGHATAYRVD
ncbi:hypothetical protein DAPPUDRAFT_246911 [Daphnia pulex]|uniref:Cuticular protein n=1 Tax=Daphnia pulex TaxID=6669 RepID=E9GRF1_DAPPU|nr:hypothetical protein DAPPUDRAFT_246911 [Daphnia pulex]|eukprot:EFX77996.1 hypothetical protein DAPPUDRAFT_246911 [Daphnia pulex]